MRGTREGIGHCEGNGRGVRENHNGIDTQAYNNHSKSVIQVGSSMIAHLVCPSLDHYDVPLALGRRLLHHVCTAAHHDAVPGRCVAPLELLKEAIHVAELRRTVGVYHQHELPACTQHALAHGATFAVVPEKLEQSHGVCAVLLDVALHHRACAVSTAVVDDDNLVREATEGGKWWVGVGDGVRRGEEAREEQK